MTDRAVQKKAWAEANREKMRTAQRAYYERNRAARCADKRASRAKLRAENPDAVKAANRLQSRRRAGVEGATAETRDGPCENAGCSYVGRLVLDHDHSTGAVRGWLCSQCNVALGMAGDSAERLRQLAAYRERF